MINADDFLASSARAHARRTVAEHDALAVRIAAFVSRLPPDYRELAATEITGIAGEAMREGWRMRAEAEMEART